MNVERLTKKRLEDVGIDLTSALNLFQHLTASLSVHPRTDPEICDLARAEPNLLDAAEREQIERSQTSSG